MPGLGAEGSLGHGMCGQSRSPQAWGRAEALHYLAADTVSAATECLAPLPGHPGLSTTHPLLRVLDGVGTKGLHGDQPKTLTG